MNRVHPPPLLSLHRGCKSYGGVHALRDVSLTLYAGEVHAICGENGAGKSTLIKSLAGVVRLDSGTLEIAGRRLPTGNVLASELAGIAVMHQESTAFSDLSAVDNIFVGREAHRGSGWLLDHGQMHAEAGRLLVSLDQQIPLHRPLADLSLAQRQMVILARALSRKCRIVIMDEPTASLSSRECETLLQIVSRLREAQVAVLYVSHRLDEIFRIANRITVLRDGMHVATEPIAHWDTAQLVQAMVGRPVAAPVAVNELASVEQAPVRLEVRGLAARGQFHDITFRVKAGEVVGLAGLVGAGRSEIARAVFGLDRYDHGEVLIDGTPLSAGRVAHSINAGMALVPEDRQQEGLVLPMSVRENVSLAILRRICPRGWIHCATENAVVDQQLTRLQVKTAHRDVAAETLSGGNQQKLVLGKWLAMNPQILLLDEPTRGVDVGAKAQVHQLIRDCTARGMATLLISSDLPELLSLSDRVLIVREGRIAGELSRAEASQQSILRLALPSSPAAEQLAPKTGPIPGQAQLRSPTPTGPVASATTTYLWRIMARRETGLFFLIAAICVLVGMVDSAFFTIANWQDILTRGAPTAIVACGVMLVVVTGEIDISVGSAMALLAAVMGLLLSRNHVGWPWWLGLPVVLLLGSLLGLVNGLLITLGRVPSIIVTLGMLTALRGATTLAMQGENITGLPADLSRWCETGVWYFPFPISIAAALLAIGSTHLLIKHCALGRRLFAIGSNPYAAKMIGLSAVRGKLFAFTFVGFLTALATIVDVPRLPHIEAGIGVGFELLVVTCVVVGGVSVAGGRGRLSGVLLAVVLMTMIRPVLTFLALGESGEKWTKAIQGVCILLAVVLDSTLTRRSFGGDNRHA